MNYSKRKWAIVNVSDITDEMIEDSIQSSSNSLRKSLDNSKAILKYDGRKPRSLYGKTVYSYSQILEIMSGEEWNDDSL